MLKRILITLGNSDYSKAAMETGINLAKLHKAELTGIVVLEEESRRKSLDITPAGGIKIAKKMQELKVTEAQHYIETLLHSFSERCEQAGLKHQKDTVQGISGKMIIHHAKFFDLIVTGLKNYFHYHPNPDTNSIKSFTEIFDESITPILAVPQNKVLPFDKKTPQRVLICLDDKIHSARALKHFSGVVFPDAYEITIITSTKNKNEADYLLANAEYFLKEHNFAHINPVWTKKDLLIALEEEYMSKADLVVIGYKKSFIDFKGGITERIIKEDSKPLLIGS